ncbi:MAG: DNA-binding protein [Chlorobium sp.]
MSTVTIRDFDPANDLDNDEVIVEYLKATAEETNPEVFLEALGDVHHGIVRPHEKDFRF